MYVRVISFGTNWWAMCSRDTSDPYCFRRRAAWFNAAALMSGRRLHHSAIFAGHGPLQLEKRVRSGVSVARNWQDISVLTAPPIRWKDALAVRAPHLRDDARRIPRHTAVLGTWRHSVWQTGMEVGRRQSHLDKFARPEVRSDVAFRRPGLGRERPRTMAGRSEPMPNPA